MKRLILNWIYRGQGGVSDIDYHYIDWKETIKLVIMEIEYLWWWYCTPSGRRAAKMYKDE